MMEQLQHPSQGNHPIVTALKDLIEESKGLFLQVDELYKLIGQQLRTAQDQQVKDLITEMRTRTGAFSYAVITILWYDGLNLLNRIANYKKLIEGQEGKDIKTEAEKAKKAIEDAAEKFEKTITYVKDTVEKLNQGASTLTQKLQSLQSSAQQQEIASVIQQATSEIGNISNSINSIAQKLGDLENIFTQIKQEVNQLEQQTTTTKTSNDKEGADGTTSTPSEQDLPTQLGELETKIVNLYQAVVALESVVNTANSAASIIPANIEGMNTTSLAEKLRQMRPRNFYTNIQALEQYTGRELPDIFAILNPPENQEQGNVTQLNLLKQQEVSNTDIPESIKSYLEEVKTLLLDARNLMEANLNNILEELSKLGGKLGQISDIRIAQEAKRIYSIPTLVILNECKSKLTEDMPRSRIEEIAPIVGAILIGVMFWDSFLKWDKVNDAMRGLTNIAGKFQDPVTNTALSNIKGSASSKLKQSKPALKEAPVPPATAEEVGATVLAAIASKFVKSPEEQAGLKIQAQRQQEKKLQGFRVITDPSTVKKITDEVKIRGVIPRLGMILDPKRGGVVRNIKTMINAFAEYMAESWTEIKNQIEEDIREGRLSDPQKKIQQALDKIDNSWDNLLEKMRATKWREYSLDIGLEKEKIEGIKRELEQLIDEFFELLEAWKAAKKPQEGALDIEELFFQPLGLPALKAALRTLPPSIPGGAGTRKVTRRKEAGGPQVAPKKEEKETQADKVDEGEGPQVAPKKEGEAPKRLRYRGRQRGPVNPRGPSMPTSSHLAGGKETSEKTLQGEIGRAINFIKAGKVDDAIKAVANAIQVLDGIIRQKPQPQGAPSARLRDAEIYLKAARQKLLNARRLGPDSYGFKTSLKEANSFPQDALIALSNQTAGSSPYLGRNLLLLMKILNSMPAMAQSRRQEDKDEAILEKETI